MVYQASKQAYVPKIYQAQASWFKINEMKRDIK